MRLFNISLLICALLCVSAVADDYKIFTRNYLEQTNESSEPGVNEQSPDVLSVFGAPGEYEPVTILIRAYRNMNGVKLELAGDLQSVRHSAKIPKENVEIKTVVYQTRLDTQKRLEYLLKEKPYINIAANTTRRFWITIKIPENCPGNVYETQLLVKEGSDIIDTITYRVKVLPIQLAQADTDYFFYFRPHFLADWANTSEYLTKCYKDMKEHGFNGITPYVYPEKTWPHIADPLTNNADNVEDWPTWQDYFDAIENSGIFVTGPRKLIWVTAAVYTPYGGYNEAIVDVIKDACQQKEYNIYFYGIDEPETTDPNEIAEMKSILAAMKTYHPDIPITTALGPNGLENFGIDYDCWIYPGFCLSLDYGNVLQRSESENKELFTYECALAATDTLSARHYAGYFAWKSQVKGLAFWCYSDGRVEAGHHNWITIPSWDESKMNRLDFVWLEESGPVASVGYEAAREGIDDYRYILTLKNTIQKAKDQGHSGHELVVEAESFLNSFNDRLSLDGYGNAYVAVKDKPGYDRFYSRPVPDSGLHIRDYDNYRYKVAKYIMRLAKELDI